MEGPWQRPNLEVHIPGPSAPAEAHHAASSAYLPGRGGFPALRRHLDPEHTSRDAGHTRKHTCRYRAPAEVCSSHLQNVTLGPPPQAAPHEHIHKVHPCLLKPREHHCRFTQGPARWLLVHEGKCTYPWLCSPPVPGKSQESGREPLPLQGHVHLCACVHTVLATSSMG